MVYAKSNLGSSIFINLHKAQIENNRRSQKQLNVHQFVCNMKMHPTKIGLCNLLFLTLFDMVVCLW
jgi:hypothetical protein